MAVGYIRHWGIGRQMRFITEGGLKFSQKAVKIWLKNGGHLNSFFFKLDFLKRIKLKIIKIKKQKGVRGCVVKEERRSQLRRKVLPSLN
jgi:hypothetical protein